MTLREALLESNNAAAVLLQQQVGTGPVLRLARDLGVRESARRAVAGARQRPGDAARAHGGLRGVSERSATACSRAGLVSVENAAGETRAPGARRARADPARSRSRSRW